MQTRILAHRGFCKDHIENTLSAFEDALKIGVDGIELDVHLSKDGELIVHHDFDLSRLTKSNAFIRDLTLKEIKKIDLSGTEIPTLSEVLSLITHFKQNHHLGTFLLNVELKAGNQFYPKIEEKTIELCSNFLSNEELIISSFDHHALKNIKIKYPQVSTGVLTTASLVDPWEYLDKIKADFYHPYYLTLTKENLRAMLLQKMKVNTYTLNDEGTARALIQNGIHAIITDNSQVMVDLKKEVFHETQH